MESRISIKNLAGLAMPDQCPRCQWLKLQLDFKSPWSMFPGVFSILDGYAKTITKQHHERFGCLPPWMSNAGFKGVPQPKMHWSKFSIVDETTGLTYRGELDEMLKDGQDLWILDYKTSKYDAGKDKLAPLYRAQLNGYGYIAEKLKLGTVKGLALVYCEPVGDVDDITKVLQGEAAYTMLFRQTIVPVELDLGIIPPLLLKAKALMDTEKAPASSLKCKDCDILNQISTTMQA